MLDFDLVHVHGYVGIAEVFEAAGVVEMQVAHHEYCDVLDVVSCCGDGGGEFVDFGGVDAREDVVQ